MNFYTILVLLSFVLTPFVALFVASFMAKRYISKKEAEIEKTIRSFVEPSSEGEFSPLGQAVSGVSRQLAVDITNQIKTTLMGVQSGVSRGEKALEADMAQDLVNIQNPAIGAILESLPGVAKRLRKNPALMPVAMQLLQNFANKGGSGGGNSHGNQSRLSIY